jgi:hypothetical protein
LRLSLPHLIAVPQWPLIWPSDPNQTTYRQVIRKSDTTCWSTSRFCRPILTSQSLMKCGKFGRTDPPGRPSGDHRGTSADGFRAYGLTTRPHTPQEQLPGDPLQYVVTDMQPALDRGP